MPWTNQTGGKGKGPWSGNGNGDDRGGRGGRQGPWGGGSGGGGGRPPDFEDMIRRGQANVKRFMPGGIGSPRGIILIALAALVIWLLTGWYRVNPEQLGVELVFGKHVDTTSQGLHWNWPAPVGDVFRPNVTRENTTEVGFRSAGNNRGRNVTNVSSEAEMLTGDENIIDIQVVVFWRIDQRPTTIRQDGEEETVTTGGVTNFLFNIRNPEQAVKDVTEAALREIVGRSDFESVRTTGRVRLENEAAELVQAVLDMYGAGVQVLRVKLQSVDPPENVLNAFRDVQAARADKESTINEAARYSNQVVPRARGESEQIIRDAEAFKQERVANAQGETSRFIAVLEEYQSAPEITRRRIYMETMRNVLRDMDKIMIMGRDQAGVLPYLPLRELTDPRSRTSGDRSIRGSSEQSGDTGGQQSQAGSTERGRN